MNNYKLQYTSIWRFPERGNWSTHCGDYRGNWSPHVPRNLILKYTIENDLILDQFVGSGTTLIECKILGRNSIGVDTNAKAIEITRQRTDFLHSDFTSTKLQVGDSRNLYFIESESIDFICTHPPYSNIIKYSCNNSDDLSLHSYDDFLDDLGGFATESFRVLKSGKFCSFMMGDIRRHAKLYPLGFESMQIFLRCGFILKEIIIKEQFNCTSTNYWITKKDRINFYLLAHEYIFVFYKPELKGSTKQPVLTDRECL